MKHTFLIRRAALTDLKDIARYTRKNWGISQEKLYIKGIFDCFDKIVKHETFNVDFSHIKAGCFKCKVNHHLVFFQWHNDGRPEIIRILHEEMDIPMQLVKS
jgi:toxin ParE1/3/4